MYANQALCLRGSNWRLSNMSSSSLNHTFMLEQARDRAGTSGRILDFGCGLGHFVDLGRRAGLDIWGTDTFKGQFGHWAERIPESSRPYIRASQSGIPFEDNRFDVVVSNMVFEHVDDFAGAIAEIHRVLKPGGALIAAFPVRETWYEGHVGLYFVHRLPMNSRAQLLYLRFSHSLGLGLYRGRRSSAEWAKVMIGTMMNSCHYHPRRKVMSILRTAFKGEPQSLADAFMRHRFDKRPMKGVGLVMRTAIGLPLMRAIVRIRLGLCFVVTKQPA
jgi:SAM-dependent methyltransferase